MCKLQGLMDKGGHYDVEKTGWMQKGGIITCKLKGRMDKGGCKKGGIIMCKLKGRLDKGGGGAL